MDNDGKTVKKGNRYAPWLMLVAVVAIIAFGAVCLFDVDDAEVKSAPAEGEESIESAETSAPAEVEFDPEDDAVVLQDNSVESGEAQSDAEPEPTPEEKRVTAYETFFDELVKRQENDEWRPSDAQIADFKRKFDSLTAEQKLEQIPHAQNLFDDRSIGFLKAIVMDPKEPKDVLESIYFDLLNRPEELKYPLFREIYKIDNHPLREEIEELDAMLGD